MPFHDQEWEDLQRDCDIFPAYTDYIYGPDKRLIVTQEPGLHPMIYRTDKSAPVRYTSSMPSRSWSYKTAESLDKPKTVPTGELPGHNEFGNGEMSGESSGSSTPGLDVLPHTSSPLYPLLPPQGVRTVSEKEMAQRKMLNASQRHPKPGSTTQRNASVVPKPGGQPQQPSFLRSSSTTDVDENLAQMVPRHKLAIPSPFTSMTPMLPQPANVSHQPQHSTGLSSDCSPTPASNVSADPSKQIPLLRPNDLLRDQRYNHLPLDKRMEIARFLHENMVVVRNSSDNALRAKALTKIKNATMMVNQSMPGMQSAMEWQKQSSQQLQMQADQMHQIQQAQPVPEVPHGSAQPQLQPGISPLQSAQAFPNQYYHVSQTPQQQMQSPPLPAPQDHQQNCQSQSPSQQQYQQTPQQQMQPPQIPAPQDHQQNYQSQPPSYAESPSQQQYTQTPSNQNSTPIPVPLQVSGQLRTNIDRHIPQVWQCLIITRNTSESCSEEAAQIRERARRWLDQFKMSLPAEGRMYLMQTVQRLITEHKQGKDALAYLGYKARPA